MNTKAASHKTLVQLLYQNQYFLKLATTIRVCSFNYPCCSPIKPSLTPGFWLGMSLVSVAHLIDRVITSIADRRAKRRLQMARLEREKQLRERSVLQQDLVIDDGV